jgi:hypothetical protein
MPVSPTSSGSPGGEPALDPVLTSLKDMLARRLAAPFPQSDDERMSWLENHLREVTAVMAGPARNAPVPAPELVSQSILMAREIVPDIRRAVRASAAEFISDCDAAAATGVALITLGAIGGGPVGALAGFGYGVVLLVTSC